MDDIKRDLLIRSSAYGFVICVCILLLAGALYGKNTGRIILFTIIPVYSAYYVVMYRATCKGYKDEIKKMYCYGLLARGTLTGVIYYLSATLVLLISYLLIIVAYASISSN